MNKVIWKLTEDEKKEIQQLFEKRIALENLVNIIDPKNEDLYDKIITDYGKTMENFQNWWSAMGKKYEWEGQNWTVNFDTNEVSLVSQ